MYYPFIGYLNKNIGTIFKNREKSNDTVKSVSDRLLSKNESLFIYYQGTRQKRY
jgi:hypothetical protein